MSELFDMICEKEQLNPSEHQLSLPRTGTRKVTFDSGTAVGALKIREVAIIRTILSDSGAGSVEMEDDSIEDLLDIEGEEVNMSTYYLATVFLMACVILLTSEFILAILDVSEIS